MVGAAPVAAVGHEAGAERWVRHQRLLCVQVMDPTAALQLRQLLISIEAAAAADTSTMAADTTKLRGRQLRRQKTSSFTWYE
jgi:hypothetical protein